MVISSGIFVTDHSLMSVTSQPSWHTTASLVAVGCSCAALVISFLGLAQFDLPITKYVRSVTVHLPWEQLTIPWMAFTSNAGDWIGQGWHLTAFSILLLGVAWVLKKPSIVVAAVESLVAHGIAAIIVNGLKHLIGRPRPKFVHSGDWQMSLSLTSGLDSFPSGHSAASFAVAAVLAKRFPRFGLVWIGIAAFVALSRVLRGSHFLTDVVGGAVLGVLSAAMSSVPLQPWRCTFRDGMRHAAIGASTVLGLLWALSHRMDAGVVGTLFVGLGISAIVGGLWLRRVHWFRTDPSSGGWEANASAPLIAYGLAAMTTSPLVLAAVGFVCVASWLSPTERSNKQEIPDPCRFVMQEGAILVGLVLALLILVDARGVLPFQ